MAIEGWRRKKTQESSSGDLAGLRTAKGLTLRQVEDVTKKKVSNADRASLNTDK